MVFSGLTFLQCFLPAVLLAYFMVGRTLKNLVLFIFSLLFYSWGEPIYVILMIFSTILDYSCGQVVDHYRNSPKAKIGLYISIIVNLSLLCFFKYTDFFINTINDLFKCSIPLLNLPLPIGISFYTFQTMSYTIDVYRGDAKVQNNIISFGAYVTLFPQLIAGPIVRYQDVADQLDERKLSYDKFAEGVKRFTIGLGKKVLLANNIGLLWNNICNSDLTNLSLLSSWLGIIAFAFQIYFDFSGYSDMAIGLGKMIGFDFVENFDHPYQSTSITEFWRRWHISMGSWFRDYLYIPLGGNRKGLKLQIRNILIVWLLTGLWHGASWNYVLWGLFYGIILTIEKLFLLKVLKKAPKILAHFYTLSCILIGWVLFSFEDLSSGLTYLKIMFCSNKIIDNVALYNLASYLPLLIICAIFSTDIINKLYQRIEKKCNEKAMTFIDIFVMVIILVLSIAYIISGSYNPFLYFRF